MMRPDVLIPLLEVVIVLSCSNFPKNFLVVVAIPICLRTSFQFLLSSELFLSNRFGVLLSWLSKL